MFTASGSALLSKKEKAVSAEDMIKRLQSKIQIAFEVQRLDPLFHDQKEFDESGVFLGESRYFSYFCPY